MFTASPSLDRVIGQARHPQVDTFGDALRLFKIGYSWGGLVSLAVPYDVPSMQAMPTPYAGALVRLSVGLEAIEDLRGTKGQALVLNQPPVGN